MGAGTIPFHRTVAGTAGAVLVISLVIVVLPRPPRTVAHTRTKAGTVSQEITYAYGRPVKYQHCVRKGPLYPSGYGCLQYVTKTRMENCSGPGPGCSVINKYIRLTCSGYWVGRACRESIQHDHPTTTEATTTTTTRAPATTTTTKAPTTTTTAPRTTDRPRSTRPRSTPTTRARPTPTTQAARPTATTTTTRPPRTTTTRPPQTTTTTRPPTTTTTRPTTTTTTRPPAPTRCLPLSEHDLNPIRDRFGWGTVLARPQGMKSGVAGGDQIPAGKGPARLFVTSNMLVESAAATPRVWPLAPSGVTMTGPGAGAANATDCQWELKSVRSEWRELLAWRRADRTQMRRVAPEFVKQWDRLSGPQRRAVQARHHSSGVFDPADVECEVGQNEESDCFFYISHPSVWEWKLWGTFRTETGASPQEQRLLVFRGASLLHRLIDYTSSTARTCGGADC